MPKGYILALCIAIVVIIAIWASFLLSVSTGVITISFLPKELNSLASIGDTFGILNSLFTGIALAAIVVAIFMQAQQLKDQVEANEVYKEEVAATLKNLERENAWKSVESKMHLIPLLSETYEAELASLLNKHRVEALEASNFTALYKSKSVLVKISQALDGHQQYLDQRREGVLEKKKKLTDENEQFAERMRELSASEQDVSDIQKDYAQAWSRLHSEAQSVNSSLDQIEVSNEGVRKMRAILADLERLADEYERAFQKAYEMTS